MLNENRTLWKLQRHKIFVYLRQHKLVKKFKLKFKGFGEYIFVTFAGDIREVWIVRNTINYHNNQLYYRYRRVYTIPMEDCLTHNRLSRFAEFESANNKMFVISYKQFKKLAFVDQRMLVHELIDDLVNEGWIQSEYPLELLDHEYKAYASSNAKICAYTANRIISENFRTHEYYKLIEHFLPIHLYQGSHNRKPIAEAWTHKYLYKAIKHILRLRLDISRSNIAMVLQSHVILSGPRLHNPNMWRAIIGRFAPDAKSIRDIDPGWGMKALAAAAMNIQYRFENFQYADEMIEMANFIGLNAAEYTDEQCDLCILSNYPTRFAEACAKLNKYLGKHQRTLIIAHKDDYAAIIAKYKPNRSCFLTYCHPTRTIVLNTHYLLLYQR